MRAIAKIYKINLKEFKTQTIAIKSKEINDKNEPRYHVDKRFAMIDIKLSVSKDKKSGCYQNIIVRSIITKVELKNKTKKNEQKNNDGD